MRKHAETSGEKRAVFAQKSGVMTATVPKAPNNATVSAGYRRYPEKESRATGRRRRGRSLVTRRIAKPNADTGAGVDHAL